MVGSINKVKIKQCLISHVKDMDFILKAKESHLKFLSKEMIALTTLLTS